METTYASREDGGIQEQNYMPRLTALAKENISFSDTDKLGGIYSTNNTNWTMAALFAGTSGLPFAFPVDQNSMNKYTKFAPEITSIGDILKRDGYRQVFLCGSDGEYGGRALYFREHGDYEIHDLFEARRRGEIPEDYYVWWGFEDRVLFRLAREELTRLAAGNEPFNLTLLTVDAHHLGGFTCEECGTEYADRTANVIACTDRQVGEFVDWCREQPFWENTVLIMTGDHPRMDTCLTGGMEFQERRIYNSFLNARKTPAGKTTFRTAVMMDLYPTMLSAMGYEIEGDRLGLGTDLFSGTPTLAEEMGYERLNEEVQKYSQYFIDHFAR
jgi:phosphoglycerol transferase